MKHRPFRGLRMNRIKPVPVEKDGCGKWRYATQVDAGIALGRSRRTAQERKVPVRSYFCPRCRYWHLTSMPERN